jgi:hypothetical protein
LRVRAAREKQEMTSAFDAPKQQIDAILLPVTDLPADDPKAIEARERARAVGLLGLAHSRQYGRPSRDRV